MKNNGRPGGEKDPIKSKINDMSNPKEVPTKRRINDNMAGAQKILKEPQQERKMDPRGPGEGFEEKKLSGLMSILHFEKAVQGEVSD